MQQSFVPLLSYDHNLSLEDLLNVEALKGPLVSQFPPAEVNSL